MGINQSKIKGDQESLEINHQQFKKITIIKTNQGNLLQIAIPFVNPKSVQQWKQQYQSLQKHKCLFLPVSHQEDNSSFSNLCGNHHIYKINYPNHPYLLYDQIQKTAKQPSGPQENQNIWYLLYVLVESAKILHEKGRKVGDIRPKNIFLNVQGQIKVGNIFSWPQETTNYEKYIFNKQITYLSPQQIKQSCFGHEQQTDIFLSQSFSIGLTLLDRILKTDSSNLYNLNGRFNYQQFQNRLNYLRNSKSEIQLTLKEIVLGLCNVNFNLRYKCNEIYQWLKLYQKQIIGKEKFNFHQYPHFINSNASTEAPFKEKNIYVQSQVVPVSIYPGATFKNYTFKQQNLASIINYQQNEVKLGEVAKKQTQQQIQQKERQIEQKDYKITFKSRQQGGYQIDSFSEKLKKIEQQLQQSRKMFPS